MKSFYFSHDKDARNDPKVCSVRAKFGMEGYGCYFALLEILFGEEEHTLPYDAVQFQALAFDLRCSFDIQSFLDDCITVGLFQTDGSRFWSDSFNRRLNETADRMQRRSSAGAKAAKARWSKAKKTQQKELQQDYSFSIDSVDPEWLRVMQTYESELGLFPIGTIGDEISGLFDELGADVVCEAIRHTNRKQAQNPAPYLAKILMNWRDQGIDTLSKAQAAIRDHERKTQSGARSEPQEPVIRGKFY